MATAMSRLVDLGCFWRAGEKGTSFSEQLVSPMGFFFRQDWGYNPRGWWLYSKWHFRCPKVFQEPKRTWKPKTGRVQGNYPHFDFSVEHLPVSKRKQLLWLYLIWASCSLLSTDSLFGLQGIMILSLGGTLCVCVMLCAKDCWGLGLSGMRNLSHRHWLFLLCVLT